MCHLKDKFEQKNLSNKKRLEQVIEFAESDRFLKGKVNKTTYHFLLSQISQQCKKSRGRRYTLNDKIFALSLLKQSPRCYKLLKKVFSLPSRKTLMKLLKKHLFQSGINNNIIEKLKEDVSQMRPIDKFCMLVFDEMSIDVGLSYNKSEDCIDGLQEIGVREKKFADHVMVFMLRGIAKKWKQPVGYFFVQGTMNKVEIAKNIRQCISAVHQAGLRIVGTVCDQYSSSAINYLIDSSRKDFRDKNMEYRSEGFFVNETEIIPIYDPPHLLKGIRNNLLKYDCMFIWKGKQQKASWDHIKKFYELDCGDYDTKMCYKLTEAHIYKDKMKKMKVKLAAQVFSQRVSSSMRALLKYGKLIV